MQVRAAALHVKYYTECFYSSRVGRRLKPGCRCPYLVTPRFKRGDLDHQPLYFHPMKLQTNIPFYVEKHQNIFYKQTW
jgi:hypothetical protein